MLSKTGFLDLIAIPNCLASHCDGRYRVGLSSMKDITPSMFGNLDVDEFLAMDERQYNKHSSDNDTDDCSRQEADLPHDTAIEEQHPLKIKPSNPMIPLLPISFPKVTSINYI